MENNQQPENLSGKIANTLSARSLAHNRSIVPLGYILILILFAFSLCDFKCNVQRVGSVTGYDLIMGKFVKGNPMLKMPDEGEIKKLIKPIYKTYEDEKGHEVTAMHIPSSPWAIISLVTVLLGLISYMFAHSYKPHVAVTTGSIGVLSMLVLQSQLSALINQRYTYLIQADFTLAYWLIVITFFSIAAAGFYRLRYPLPTIELVGDQGLDNEDVTDLAGHPGFEDFFTKYKWALLATILIIVSGTVFYKSYIGKDYTDEVKDLAKEAYQCDKEKLQRENSEFGKLIGKIKTAKPEDYSDLNRQFNKLHNKIERDYDRCGNSIRKKFEELSMRAVDGENFASQDELQEKFKDFIDELKDSLDNGEESIKEKAEDMLDSLQRAGYNSPFDVVAPPAVDDK